MALHAYGTMRYDLLIFDCDGVLVDSEMLAIGAMRQVLNAAGVPVTEAQILGCFGMKQSDTLQRLADMTGHPVPPHAATDLWPATRRAFEAALIPMPGVVAFLEGRAGPARCVASSSHPERIRTSLGLTGLTRFFGEALFSSHEVARGKPAPDLFLLAAARMGVAPERCAVIEDSVFGIAGACAAGMAAFGFTGGAHIQPGHAAALEAAGARGIAADWPALAMLLAA